MRLATVLGALALLPAVAGTADVASGTLLLDAAVNGDAIFCVGERGTILHSTDHAASWRLVTAPTRAPLTAVSFASDQEGWIAGHEGVILGTRDAGLSWASSWQSKNPADSFLDIIALDERHVIAVGAYGLYVASMDGGKTWERRTILEDDFHLNRITRGPTGTLYLAGEHGTLLRSLDQGERWEAIPTPYDGSFYGVLPLGPSSLLAYGLRGRVFRSDDDGASWQPVATDESTLLATGVKLASGHVVLAGQARALLVSADARTSFARRDVGVVSGIAELVVLTNGNLLAVGEAGVSLIPAGALALPERHTAPADRRNR